MIDIEKSKGIGDLGYRVGQVHTGKGIANHALKILLEKKSLMKVESHKLMRKRQQIT